MNDVPPPKPTRSRWLLWIVSFMVIAALIGGIMTIRGKRLPRMDRERLDAARSMWASQKLNDYEISITVSGRQPGVYTVGVEQGIAKTATLDGRNLKRPRTFGTWSVDGMLETLQRDFDTQEENGNLLLGADFHETLGIPMRYERIEMQTGMHDALQWEVTRFEQR